jgi:hypothetical protein
VGQLATVTSDSTFFLKTAKSKQAIPLTSEELTQSKPNTRVFPLKADHIKNPARRDLLIFCDNDRGDINKQTQLVHLFKERWHQTKRHRKTAIRGKYLPHIHQYDTLKQEILQVQELMAAIAELETEESSKNKGKERAKTPEESSDTSSDKETESLINQQIRNSPVHLHQILTPARITSLLGMTTHTVTAESSTQQGQGPQMQNTSQVSLPEQKPTKDHISELFNRHLK